MDRFGNDLQAGAATLQYVIVLTVILTIAFLYLFIKDRKNKEVKTG